MFKPNKIKDMSKFSRFWGSLCEDSILLFGGKSLNKEKSTSPYIPMTLEQVAIENRRTKVRRGFTRFVALGSVSLLLGSISLQVGSSVLGLKADYTVAHADNAQGKKSSAMERSIDQLKIAAGEADGSLSSGAKALSPSEVKTVGFFVSNWYSPFVTQVKTSTGGVVGDYQSDIQKLLTTHAGLAEDPAGELAKMVAEVGAKTTEKLYLAKSDDGGQTWTALSEEATYYEVLLGSVGIFPESLFTTDDEISLKKRYQYDESKGTILGLVREALKDEKSIQRQSVVYEWNPNPSKEPTVAQATFYTNFSSVDSSKSWGSTVLSLDGQDPLIAKWFKEQPSDLTERLNGYLNGFMGSDGKYTTVDGSAGSLKGFYDRSIYSASMYVDGFGNLISDTGSNSLASYVIMPASQNPMMYARKVTGNSSSSDSSSGKDKSKDKEKDKSKESSDSKGKSSSSITGVDAKMSAIYNAKDTGVGRSIASNNLNSVALNKGKGYLKVDGENATLGGSVDKSLTFYSALTSGENLTYDSADTTKLIFGIFPVNVSDLGSVVASSLYTQWLIRNGNESETYKGDAGKIFENKSGGWNYGAPYSEIRSGSGDLGLPQGKPKDSYYVFGGGGSAFDLLAHAKGADSWSVFTSKAFSDDVYKWKSSLSVTKPVIDDMITFDSEGYGSGNSKFKKLGDNGTLLIGKAQEIELQSSRLDGSGYWKGQGLAGGLVDTAGDAPKDTSDKKYAANLYASTVLVRANPLNKDIPYVINLDNSSVIDEDALKSASEGDEEDLDHVLKNMAYFMLNPTKGREYKQRWSKTFMNQALLSSLEDMIGANTASSYSGTTRYLELTGFATIPRMNEIKFTDYLYSKFASWGVTILIVASFLMLIFLFVGQIRVVPAVLSILAFGYLLYSPPKMIDASTHLSNQITSYFFKDKFLFWVMATHQNYSDSVAQLQKAAEAGNYDNYTALLVKLQGGWGGSENEGETDVYEWQQTLGASVKVRWMAPKKDGYIQQVKRDLKQVTSESEDKANKDKEADKSAETKQGE